MGSYRKKDIKRNRVTGTKTKKTETIYTQETDRSQTTCSVSS